jgi:DNA ligase (NAD+)
MLTYVADRTVLELDGLGSELAAKLVETGMVESLPSCLSDLIQFRSDFVSSIRVLGQNAVNHTLVERGFPVILTLRMFDSIETAKTALWPNWIAAFGIPMVGRRLGKVLANKLKLQPEDLPNLPAKFAQIKLGEIDGLGVSKLGELHRFAKNPSSAELCSKLFDEGVRPTATVPASTSGARPLEGVAFLITGEFEAFGTRETITAKLEALGAISKSGVSKNVTHLLVGTDPGRSKLAKAEQLGIRQVGSEWLADKLSASLRA